MIKTEYDIVRLIESDDWMMNILRAVRTLNLPDWWVCAGFVRSKVWDALHDFSNKTLLPDIDVIYYEAQNMDESVEKTLEEKLGYIMPGEPWSVKNQARMHLINDFPPYTSSVDAISKFPETVTALGVKIDEKGELILKAPWGIEDLVNLEVNPTSMYLKTEDRMAYYRERVNKKNWKKTWTKVRIHLY